MKILLILFFVLLASCNDKDQSFDPPAKSKITLNQKEQDIVRGKKLIDSFDGNVFYDDEQTTEKTKSSSTIDSQIELISSDFGDDISRYMNVLEGVLNLSIKRSDDLNEQIVDIIKITAEQRAEYKHLYILIKIINIIKNKFEFNQESLFDSNEFLSALYSLVENGLQHLDRPIFQLYGLDRLVSNKSNFITIFTPIILGSSTDVTFSAVEHEIIKRYADSIASIEVEDEIELLEETYIHLADIFSKNAIWQLKNYTTIDSPLVGISNLSRALDNVFVDGLSAKLSSRAQYIKFQAFDLKLINFSSENSESLVFVNVNHLIKECDESVVSAFYPLLKYSFQKYLSEEIADDSGFLKKYLSAKFNAGNEVKLFYRYKNILASINAIRGPGVVTDELNLSFKSYIQKLSEKSSVEIERMEDGSIFLKGKGTIQLSEIVKNKSMGGGILSYPGIVILLDDHVSLSFAKNSIFSTYDEESLDNGILAEITRSTAKGSIPVQRHVPRRYESYKCKYNRPFKKCWGEDRFAHTFSITQGKAPSRPILPLPMNKPDSIKLSISSLSGSNTSVFLSRGQNGAKGIQGISSPLCNESGVYTPWQGLEGVTRTAGNNSTGFNSGRRGLSPVRRDVNAGLGSDGEAGRDGPNFTISKPFLNNGPALAFLAGAGGLPGDMASCRSGLESLQELEGSVGARGKTGVLVIGAFNQ
ncbi:MAG: hypothetical protein KAG61_12170 [Bacteriovoracaceae bacterium]|nr:hypothetical protein [Bacteriovoracaceae bacterium]